MPPIADRNVARGRQRLEARKGRSCEYCDEPIPLDRRVSARFCSSRCQRTNDRMRTYQQGLNRKRLYGITPDEFVAMLEAQDGRCAICSGTEPGGKGGWHVDHDHDSGELRGLLCHYCNIMLGMAKDDVGRLRAAVAYLER